MSNIINGVATDYEIPATNYVGGTTMTEQETDKVIVNVNSNDINADTKAFISVIKKMHNEDGYELSYIARLLGLSIDNVQKLYDEDIPDGYELQGKNKEYYPDPTYYQAMKNADNYKHAKLESARVHSDNCEKLPPFSNDVKLYTPRRSRRYQLVGLIRKMANMAGFEVVDRIVLKDMKTGEVLR